MNNAPSIVILTSVIPQALDSMLSGVLQYAREHGPWRIYQVERRKWMYTFEDWSSWGADAIIAADHHDIEEAAKIASMGIPVVILIQPHKMRDKSYPLSRFPCCIWNSENIGKMAAAYLKGKGYENFAFVDDTVKETYWSVDRERAFRRALPKKSCYARYGGASAREREDWMLERPHLARWLRSLKKPCGVFAPNDRRGKQVLDAAYAEGLNVPGEIGVLSCDNDTWICDASIPTMSSIRCDTKSAGYKIASILDDMLHGKKFPRRTEVIVEPIEVIERQSTNWYAVKDDKVAQMLKLIHENFADRDLDVTYLARVSGLARRTLEIRFKNSTGHTLRKEIEFVRISKAKSLLLENRLSVSEIAKATGYASPAQFCLRFKLATGKTPRAFASSMTATEAT